MQINDHKFCFIICTNNDLLLEECIHYINGLIIPSNFEIDLLTIKDAPSITQGYQEAMEASDAKYKIYMHQDVFILNKNFFGDLLAIFNSDPQIGMIGMVGYETVSPDGIMWHMPRTGHTFQNKIGLTYPKYESYSYSLKSDKYSQVALIDGLLMVTSVDLPWNQQLFNGWDFYDASHSLDMLLQNYKVVVPHQTYPWSLHDDNKLLSMNSYDSFRHVFTREYQSYLGKNLSEIRPN